MSIVQSSGLVTPERAQPYDRKAAYRCEHGDQPGNIDPHLGFSSVRMAAAVTATYERLRRTQLAHRL